MTQSLAGGYHEKSANMVNFLSNGSKNKRHLGSRRVGRRLLALFLQLTVGEPITSFLALEDPLYGKRS